MDNNRRVGIDTESSGESQSGSTFSLIYGRRPMKAYPLTDGELSHVFGLGNWATVCFSIGTLFLGMAVDVTKSLAMLNGFKESAKIFWEIFSNGCYLASIFLFLFGIILMFIRSGKIKEIKKEAIFPGT